jgi:predicted transcriptional regulator
MNDFRDWLRLELAKRNLSQKELAGLLDVTQGIISRYLASQAISDLTEK